MLPAALIDLQLGELVPLLDAGDIVIDSGNHIYRDDTRRAAELKVGDIGPVSKAELWTEPGSKREEDAETKPLRDPESYQFEITVPQLAEVSYRRSFCGSWLLDLAAQALRKEAEFGRYTGQVFHSGKGLCTVEAAIGEGIPVQVLNAALFERFSWGRGADFGNNFLSMREEFGGHTEKCAT